MNDNLKFVVDCVAERINPTAIVWDYENAVHLYRGDARFTLSLTDGWYLSCISGTSTCNKNTLLEKVVSWVVANSEKYWNESDRYNASIEENKKRAIAESLAFKAICHAYGLEYDTESLRKVARNEIVTIRKAGNDRIEITLSVSYAEALAIAEKLNKKG